MKIYDLYEVLNAHIIVNENNHTHTYTHTKAYNTKQH